MNDVLVFGSAARTCSINGFPFHRTNGLLRFPKRDPLPPQRTTVLRFDNGFGSGVFKERDNVL